MDERITLNNWPNFGTDIRGGEHGFFVNASAAPFADAFMIPKNGEHVVFIHEKLSQKSEGRALNEKDRQRFGYEISES